MNIRAITKQSRAAEVYPAHDFRVITRIFGGLLGTDFIVSTASATYRVGQLTLNQLKSGIPAEDLDLLEVDENGDPLDGAVP